MSSETQPQRSAMRGFFRLFSFRQESTHLVQAARTLRENPLFRELSYGQLLDLAYAMHYRDYKRGEIIYHEQDPGLGLYLVQSGRVRLLTQESGEPVELRQAGESDLFGDLSLFGEFRRLETAQAVTDSRLLGLFRPDLRTLARRHPRLGFAVAMLLGEQIAGRQVSLLRGLEARDGREAALLAWHGTASNRPEQSII